MNKLVVAISSSALFDLKESDRVYREEGVDAYAAYQISREDEPLAPGDAFPLVEKLLRINDLLGVAQGQERVDVILLSRNSADTGLRVFNSIEHHNLPIIRAAFTGGRPPYRYMEPFACQLFLSTHQQDVKDALGRGVAAASIVGPPYQAAVTEGELRIAFDGDAVLFSDHAERIYQEQGLEAFTANEQAKADDPLPGGPFKGFLEELHKLQKEFGPDKCPIRTALVTARSAPSHERVVKTLRSWKVKLDESLFLGELTKADFLESFGADIFFDDQAKHCLAASKVVATGHVPHGVVNE